MNEKKTLSKWKNNFQYKRKKEFQTALMKKPKLGRIFIKYFTACLSVMLVVCLLATLLAVSFYREFKKRELYIEENAMIDSLNYAYETTMQFPESEEEKEELWKAYIRRNMNATCSDDNYAVTLYDADTKEALIETRDVTNIMLVKDWNTENMRVYVYECENELMQDVTTRYEAEAEDDDESEWVELIFKDLYVKGEEVIPGKMELVQRYSAKESVILQEYDKTPADTTGYKHIVAEENPADKIIGPLVWEKKGEENNREKINAFLREYVENPDPEQGIWEYDYGSSEEDFPWGGQYAEYEMVKLGESLNVKLVIAIQVNLFADYGGWIAQIYAGLFLLTILISFALAYRNYMTKLNHYQLDVYRRETTNAMAHDLKTPLMAISGYAQNLRENVHSEKKDYYADSILEHVQYMNEMIGNILELAKVENLTEVAKKEAVNLNNVTEGILKKYDILISEKKLKVTVEGETVVQADSALITRAMENLISNAVKYAKNNTVVSVQMNKAYWKIQNTMEYEVEVAAEELWKPFIKGDNSRNLKGTGIGLTIVKNIAKVHGFDLSLQCTDKEFVATITF